MITDPGVFDDEYLPRRLLHRHAEQGQLSRLLVPSATVATPDDALLCGPSGVGKTVLARHTLDRLRDRERVDAVHVRCLGLSDADILRVVLTRLGHDVSEQWLVTDLRDALSDAIEQPTVVVLDEADGIPDSGVLDHLAGIPALSCIAICHDDADWLSRLDARHRIRFEGRHQIDLDRYGVDELGDILERRAEHGLAFGAIGRAGLEAIADTVAGVARNGIQTLRAAAELAAERETSIGDSEIGDGYDLALHRIRKASLHSLPFHHHVLYALVLDAGEIATGELHDRYDAIAERVYRNRGPTPVGKRSRRNVLAKLREYGLIECDGENRHRQYAVRDGQIAPPIEIGLPSSGDS